VLASFMLLLSLSPSPTFSSLNKLLINFTLINKKKGIETNTMDKPLKNNFLLCDI
jgi:hypothetical protein